MSIALSLLSFDGQFFSLSLNCRRHPQSALTHLPAFSQWKLIVQDSLILEELSIVVACLFLYLPIPPHSLVNVPLFLRLKQTYKRLSKLTPIINNVLLNIGSTRIWMLSKSLWRVSCFLIMSMLQVNHAFEKEWWRISGALHLLSTLKLLASLWFIYSFRPLK